MFMQHNKTEQKYNDTLGLSKNTITQYLQVVHTFAQHSIFSIGICKYNRKIL